MFAMDMVVNIKDNCWDVFRMSQLAPGLIEVPHEFSGDVVIAHQSLVGIRPRIASRCNATVFLGDRSRDCGGEWFRISHDRT